MIRPLSVDLTGQKVQVYQNLNNGQWSVKHPAHPVFHVTSCQLRRVVLKVSAKGRARVRELKQRAVHAYAEGIWAADVSEAAAWASYNPYHHVAAFYLKETGRPVYTAQAAHFTEGGKMFLKL